MQNLLNDAHTPLKINEATREMQARLRESALAMWKAHPELFWMHDDGVSRMGTPVDVHLGKLPRSLKRHA